MAEKTNRSDLVRHVAQRAAVSQDIAGHVLDAVLEKIEELAALGPVTIKGFGRFETRTLPERDARNPMTGKTIRAPERRRLAFRAAARR